MVFETVSLWVKFIAVRLVARRAFRLIQVQVRIDDIERFLSYPTAFEVMTMSNVLFAMFVTHVPGMLHDPFTLSFCWFLVHCQLLPTIDTQTLALFQNSNPLCMRPIRPAN